MEFLKKLNPKALAIAGVSTSIIGFVLSQVGESITAEQNKRLISEMVTKEIAKQLNKG